MLNMSYTPGADMFLSHVREYYTIIHQPGYDAREMARIIHHARDFFASKEESDRMLYASYAVGSQEMKVLMDELEDFANTAVINAMRQGTPIRYGNWPEPWQLRAGHRRWGTPSLRPGAREFTYRR